MSDHRLNCFLAAEKDALERYSRLKVSFVRHPEVVESAHSIWVDATAALLRHQGGKTDI